MFIEQGPRGPVIIGVPGVHKLCIPTRDSHIPLKNHDVGLVEMIRDTAPGIRKKGVQFWRIEHATDCARCATERSNAAYECRRARLRAAGIEYAWVAQPERDQLTAAYSSDESLAAVLARADHFADLSRRAAQIMLLSRQAERAAEEAVQKMAKEFWPRIQAAQNQYAAACAAVEPARKALQESERVTATHPQEKADTRILWQWTPQGVSSFLQSKVLLWEINVPESDDGYRAAGIVRLTTPQIEWRYVADGPEPDTGWVAECRIAWMTAKAAMEAAHAAYRQADAALTALLEERRTAEQSAIARSCGPLYAAIEALRGGNAG